ncbi:response regulator transcription factor [Roseospira visakhapatnamensis]|uniref:Two-component system nitrate/nitrite response regulator NarP n=1 Tax=Roseospira visakhapatnamensis TaxID=390880 RepID=A0A7W6WAT0_9PROT|nr:response regulator transcription factor [Roseospira visakhapatnamensis]MBB4266837.1 two-component system nitrate/nitrite response regulator NarP [Roseospira visakhapatnamensis]
METRARPLIDVFVADKSPLVRMAMKTLLGHDSRFNLLGTAEDGELFMRALDKLTFRVGVIGWVMPYMDGAAVLKALQERTDAPRVLVYTGDPDPAIPRRVMDLGGAGFCCKSESPERLLAAIDTVARGHMTFPYTDVARMQQARPASPLDALTARERELLACLAEGQSNADIARHFGISVHTVKFHLKNVFGKLDVSNRAGAVAAFLAES